ncbi:flagellar basal body-associated FliL family protein [Nostoc sp. HG1]|nr:flagellar basal body-associated FliL family protein [Nostoc sp. HG1]
MDKTKTPAEKPKRGKLKSILLLSVGATILSAGAAGAAVYFTGGIADKAVHEDPNRPKLVERSEEPAEAAEGEDGKPVFKEGTVSVKNDRAPVDPKKFEVTYFALEQSFTANLADGAGFVQLGLSLATYYDGKVVANITRQIVPIRSAILMVLSQQDAAVLSTPQGKQMLQRDLTRAINQVLRDKEGFGGIDDVYFTNLVIQ